MHDRSGESTALDEDLLPSATRAWVASVMAPDARLRQVERLIGGWSSEMRLLRVETPAGRRTLVLRSFTKPFFQKHAEALLTREADVLGLLAGSAIPAAHVIAMDARAEHCAFPSLLRTHLPGSIRLEQAGAPERIALLAALLVAIHRLPLRTDQRPRTYQAWTRHDRVRIPEQTGQRQLWERAIDVIRQPAPAYDGCFLHRDFHPGNVLFDQSAHATWQLTGVVDWVETSWGPAELDVAHCSTALALLHGPDAGLEFATRYGEAGGQIASDPRARLYWCLIDALHYSPDAEKLVVPWREAGRTDLTPELLCARLESYVLGLMSNLA